MSTDIPHIDELQTVHEELLNTVSLALPCELAWLLVDGSDPAVLEHQAFVSHGACREAIEVAAIEPPGQILLLGDGNLFATVLASGRALVGVPISKLKDRPGVAPVYKFITGCGVDYLSLIPLSGGGFDGMLLLGTKDALDRESVNVRRLLRFFRNQAVISLEYASLSMGRQGQEETRRVEQVFLRTLLDSMGDGLVVIGGDGSVEYVNQSLLRLTGYAEEEVIGTSVGGLFHPDDRAQLMHGLLNRRGSTIRFDQRLYSKDGTVVPVMLSRSSLAHIDPESREQVLVLSDLTEQRMREAAIERQTQQLNALNSATKAISSSLSPQDVITRILGVAVEIVDAQGASILLRNTENANELRFVAAVGPEAELIHGLRVPLGEGVAGWVAREARSQLVPDTSKDVRFYANIDASSGLATRSLIAVPLVVSDRVIGVLEVVNKQRGTFHRGDLELMESIAGTAAVAIENARLFEQTRHRVNDLGTLLDASAAVSSTLDFGSMLELIARRLLEALNVDRCVINAWDRASDTLEPMAEVVDAYWEYPTGPHQQLLPGTLRHEAITQDEPLRVQLGMPECHELDRQALVRIGQFAMMVVPFKVNDELVGLIVLSSSASFHMFTDVDLARVHRSLRDWQARIGPTFPSVWSEQRNLIDLCNLLQAIPNVMWISIEQLDPALDSVYRLREQGFGLWADSDGLRFNLRDFPTMNRVLSIAKPKVVAASRLENDPLERDQLEALGGQVCLMAPLTIRGRPEGIVKLIDADPERTFNVEQISLCQGIANVVGNAMENAHLYQSLEKRAEALEAAYGELKQANQLKDELLQNLSHEIQTPLLHVLGYVELMQSGTFGPLNDEQHDKLQFVIERAQHLSELVKNIIAVQSLQAQNMDIQSTNLEVILQQAARIWQPEAAKRAMSLNVDLPVKGCTVQADSRLLTEAVEHLLDNAIKFSPDGSQIDMTILDKGTEYEVHVRDQGIGIAPEAHQLIFQRFYQVDGGTARQFGGAGLGLAIVRETLSQHGGRIWVESSLGNGSDFVFALPKVSNGRFANGKRPLKLKRLKPLDQ